VTRTARRLVVARGQVALAELTEADRRALIAGNDRLFQVDDDPRPLPVKPPPGRYAIVDTPSGVLLGNVSWIPVLHGPTAACVAWNMGVFVLPVARGRGIGTLAQRLLVEHLFAATDTYRVEASTDVGNLAEQRALERAGFRREGVIRGAQVRGGVRRDIVLYGILRTDLETGTG